MAKSQVEKENTRPEAEETCAWSRLLENWYVTTRSSLINYDSRVLPSMSQVHSEGEELQIGTATFSPKVSHFTHMTTFEHLLPDPGLPRTYPLVGRESGMPCRYEECQVHRQKRRSHLITELRWPGARAMPLGTAQGADQGRGQGAWARPSPSSHLFFFFDGGAEPISNQFQSVSHSWKHSRAVPLQSVG